MNQITRTPNAQNLEPVSIWPGNIPPPPAPYSPAVRTGDWVFVSGFLASDFKTGMAPEAIPANSALVTDMELQTRYLMANAARTISSAGCDMSKDIVRLWQWFPSPSVKETTLAQEDTWPEINITPYLRVRSELLQQPLPATSSIANRFFPVKDTRVALEMICFANEHKPIAIHDPDDHDAELAGNSSGVRRGDWVFLSGRLPVDGPGDFGSSSFRGASSALAEKARVNPYYWHGSSIEQQTNFVLEKLARLAESAGSSLSRAVKAEVYLAHPNYFEGMDRVWKRWFPESPPARFVLPSIGLGARGALVEVALTLLADDSAIETETIETSEAPEPFSHEPQAVRAGHLLFFSQQMAFDSRGCLAEGMKRHPSFPWYGQPGRDQTRYMIRNISAICEAAGSSLENVVRCGRFFDDGQWFAESFAEWDSHFPKRKACSIAMQLLGPMLVPEANVMFDVTAYVPPK